MAQFSQIISFKHFLLLSVFLMAALLLVSCDKKDPNRNYYDVGTTLNRTVIINFLPPDQFEDKCHNIKYQDKSFGRADACASESGDPRRVYMKERLGACNETTCLTGIHWRYIKVTFIDEKSDFCGKGKHPICFKGNHLHTFQYNPMNEQHMEMVGNVLAEMFMFPAMFNDADELGHEIFSHVLNMGGSH